jgi:hypothetical protein
MTMTCNRHHLAVSYTSSVWRMYMDGQSVRESSATWPSWSTTFDQLDIASQVTDGSGSVYSQFNGNMYDVRYVYVYAIAIGSPFFIVLCNLSILMIHEYPLNRLYDTTLTGKQILQLKRAGEPQRSS